MCSSSGTRKPDDRVAQLGGVWRADANSVLGRVAHELLDGEIRDHAAAAAEHAVGMREAKSPRPRSVHHVELMS
jgi:hypothetical protein